MISEQDVQAYRRDGVIMVPDVLGADTLTLLRSVIAALPHKMNTRRARG